MKKVNRLKVYQRAIDKWGFRLQLEMAQEEATELALAVRKHIRKNTSESFKHLCEEIADVEIMIEQIRLMHPEFPVDTMICTFKDQKINRLNNRLNNNSFEE